MQVDGCGQGLKCKATGEEACCTDPECCTADLKPQAGDAAVTEERAACCTQGKDLGHIIALALPICVSSAVCLQLDASDICLMVLDALVWLALCWLRANEGVGKAVAEQGMDEGLQILDLLLVDLQNSRFIDPLSQQSSSISALQKSR